MDEVQLAATEVTISKKSFKKTPSVLLGSLVEGPKTRPAVPNHLLESSKLLLSHCSPVLEQSQEAFFSPPHNSQAKLTSYCLNWVFL